MLGVESPKKRASGDVMDPNQLPQGNTRNRSVLVHEEEKCDATLTNTEFDFDNKLAKEDDDQLRANKAPAT